MHGTVDLLALTADLTALNIFVRLTRSVYAWHGVLTAALWALAGVPRIKKGKRNSEETKLAYWLHSRQNLEFENAMHRVHRRRGKEGTPLSRQSVKTASFVLTEALWALAGVPSIKKGKRNSEETKLAYWLHPRQNLAKKMFHVKSLQRKCRTSAYAAGPPGTLQLPQFFVLPKALRLTYVLVRITLEML